MRVKEIFRRLNPAVPRRWLFLLAGVVWTCVGTFLCYRAAGWLSPADARDTALLAVTGMVLALTSSRFMLSKAASRNINRIKDLPDRSCVFAFTAWRGYGLVAVMVLLGSLLRQSPLPKPYLAVLYVAMGGSLVLSSLLFYRSFRQLS